jgi:hypothetical protein
MFRVQHSPTFWATVEAEIPNEENGKPVKFCFDIEFPRLTSSEVKALNEEILEKKLDDDDVARRLVKHRWRGVVDETDQPLERNEANVERLLSVMGTGTAIARTFFRTIQGARGKNS